MIKLSESSRIILSVLFIVFAAISAFCFAVIDIFHAFLSGILKILFQFGFFASSLGLGIIGVNLNYWNWASLIIAVISLFLAYCILKRKRTGMWISLPLIAIFALNLLAQLSVGYPKDTINNSIITISFPVFIQWFSPIIMLVLSLFGFIYLWRIKK